MKNLPDDGRSLVHVHIYYVWMWEEIKMCLQNIALPYDLCVTLVDDDPALRQAVLDFDAAADIRLVENRGYDVWPFIDMLNRVNLDEYSFVIKLHTKRDTGIYPVGNGYVFEKDGWRKALLKFLKTPRNFKKCLAAFQKDKRLGMISSFDCIHNAKIYPDALAYIKKRYPDYTFGTADFSFVAGTMFIARAEIFKPIQQMKITASLFETPDQKHSMQFAHVMERTLGEAVYKAGFRIDDPVSSRRERRLRQRDYNLKIKFWHLTWFQLKYGRGRHLLLKILGIPLWSSKNSASKHIVKEK